MINYNKILETYGQQQGYIEGLARIHRLKHNYRLADSYDKQATNIHNKAVRLKNRAKHLKRIDKNEAFLKGRKDGLKLVSETHGAPSKVSMENVNLMIMDALRKGYA